MPDTRVTVSLVTYNGMHWLWGCVMSVLRQKMGRLELHVVDNASTDGTLDFLRDAAAHDTRIQVTALDSNTGFAAAHNLNLGPEGPEFVMLLNQDVELDRFFCRRRCAYSSAARRLAPCRAVCDGSARTPSVPRSSTQRGS